MQPPIRHTHARAGPHAAPRDRPPAPGLLALLALPLLLSGCPAPDPNPDTSQPPDVHTPRRLSMVERQLAARDIRDPAVLQAMRNVPRHRFVPDSAVPFAYDDTALRIEHGQTISQPYIVAFMSQALELDGDEKVLEIGTGSGYQAAVLGHLARKVYTIEIVVPLADRARQVLADLGHTNVHVRTGDGYRGWPEEAPFDAIMVTAAPDHVPEPLVAQLAPGGRMILPVGEGYDQQLVILEKTASGLTRRAVLDVVFVPMTGEAEQR